MRRIPASAASILAALLAAACSSGVPAPVAVANAPSDVSAGSFVQLDGNTSKDPQGRGLTFSWTFVSRPLGSHAELIDANSPTPSFQADVPGTYVLELTVSSSVSSSTARVTINVSTCKATAPAIGEVKSSKTTLNIGEAAQLSADVSDADNLTPCSANQVLTYNWELIRQPAGSQTSLNTAHSETPSLVVDKAGDYVVRLTVTDSTGLSSQPKSITLNARQCGAATPSVTASATPETTHPNAAVQLNAAVTDADATCGLTQSFTYQWSISAKPNGASALFSNSRSKNPSFTADTAGSYEVRVVATDDTGRSSEPAVASVTVDRCGEAGPAADGIAFSGGTHGTPPTGTVGTAITAAAVNARSLNCLATDAPTLRWTLSVPPGSRAALDNIGAAAPSFVPDLPGAYDLQLTLLDSAGRTSVPVFGHVSVTDCTAVPPVFGTTPIAVNVSDPGAPVITDGSGATLPHVGASVQLTANATVSNYCGAIATGPLRFSWTLAQRPPGSQAQLDTSTASPSFVPDVNGRYRVAVVATDARGVAGAPQAVDVVTTSCGVNALTSSLFAESAGGLVPLSTTPAAPQAVASFAPFAVVATVATDDNDATRCPARFHVSPEISWSLAIQPASSAGSLSSVFGDSTLFEARAPGAYAVQVDAAATNLAGRAHASPVFAYFSAAGCSAPGISLHFSATGPTVFNGDAVTLAADVVPGSCGESAPIVSYNWSLAPSAASRASLSSPTASSTSFIADLPGGSFTASLVVTDLQGNRFSSAPLAIAVSSCGSNPVSAAAVDLTGPASPFDPRALRVTPSSNDDTACPARFAQTYSFSWSVVSPASAGGTFSAPSAAETTFSPGASVLYTLRALVTGSNGRSASALLAVDARCGQAPVTTSALGVSVQGDGSFPRTLMGGSYRVFRDDVVTVSTVATSGCFSASSAGFTYSWTLTAPNGSTSRLSPETAAAPSFVIDQPNGVYVATVVARDRLGNSSSQSASFAAASCGANPILAAIQVTPGARPFDEYSVLAVPAAGRTTLSDDDVSTLCPAHFAGQYAYQWSVPSSAPSTGFVFDSLTGASVRFSPGGNAVYSLKLSVSSGGKQSEALAQLAVSCSDLTPKTGAITIASSTPGYAPGVFFRDDIAMLSAHPTSLCFSEGQTGYSYLWTLTSPAGSSSFLSSTTAANPTFAVDKPHAPWTATVLVVDKLGNRSEVSQSAFSSQACGDNPVSVAVSGPTRPNGTLPFDPYDFQASPSSTDDNVAACPARFAQNYSVSWSFTATHPNALTTLTPTATVGALTSTTTLKPGGNADYTIFAHVVGSKSGNAADASGTVSVNCLDGAPTKVTAPAIAAVMTPAGDSFTRALGQFFRDDTLTLTASGSSVCFSPGNTAFTYAWMLSPVNPPALLGAATRTPSFVVNTPGGAYTASVIATDSLGNVSLAGQNTFTADTCGANPVKAKIVDTGAVLAFDPHSLTALPFSGAFFSRDDDPSACPGRFAQSYNFTWQVAAPMGASTPANYLLAPPTGSTATFSAGYNGTYDVSVRAQGTKQPGTYTAHDIITVNCGVPAPAVSMPDSVTVSDPDGYLKAGHIFAGDTVTVTGSATHACFTGTNFHPSYSWGVDSPNDPHLMAINATTASFRPTIPNGVYTLTFEVRDQWNHLGSRSIDFTTDACGANGFNAALAVSTGGKPRDVKHLTLNPVGALFSDDDDSSKCPGRFAHIYGASFTVTSSSPPAFDLVNTAALEADFTARADFNYALKADLLVGTTVVASATGSVDGTCAKPTADAPTIATVNGAAYGAQSIFAGDAVGLSAGTVSSACFTTPVFTYAWHASRNATPADEEFTAPASTTSTAVLVPAGAASHYQVSYSVSDGAKQDSANASAAFDTPNCAATAPVLTLVNATQSLDAVTRIVDGGTFSDSLKIEYPNPEDGGPPAADAGQPVGTVAVPFYLDRDMTMTIQVADPVGAGCGTYQINAATLQRPANSDAGLVGFEPATVASGGTLSFTFRPDIGNQTIDNTVVSGQYGVHLEVTTPAHQSVTADTTSVPVEGKCGLNPPVAFFEMTSTTGVVPVNVSVDGGLSSDQDNQVLAVSTTAPTTGCGLDQPLTYHWTVQDPADGGVRSDSAEPGYSFVATREGFYTVSLTVDDGKLSSAPETQVFTATDGGP